MNSSHSIRVLSTSVLALATLGSAQPTRLRAVPPAEVTRLEKSLDRKVLPAETRGTYVDRAQVFSLTETSSSTITLVPLVFETPANDGGGILRNCGVYVLAHNIATFAITLGPAESPVTKCDGLEAIGAAADGGGHPRIVLLYSVSSTNTHLHYPAVLKWDDHSNTYVLDAASTEDLGGSTTDRMTIASLRARLPKRNADGLRRKQ